MIREMELKREFFMDSKGDKDDIYLLIMNTHNCFDVDIVKWEPVDMTCRGGFKKIRYELTANFNGPIKKFKGYEVDNCGHVMENGKRTKYIIYCNETTGHPYNIFGIWENNMLISIYCFNDRSIKDEYGVEIYYYKPGTYDIKHSRNYTYYNKLPKKYENVLKELKQKHNEVFGNNL